MASRPSNIGIKAIELYFPSQVRFPLTPRFRHYTSCASFHDDHANTNCCSVSTRASSRSSMASVRGSTQLALARPRWASAMTGKVSSPTITLTFEIFATEVANVLLKMQTSTLWLSQPSLPFSANTTLTLSPSVASKLVPRLSSTSQSLLSRF